MVKYTSKCFIIVIFFVQKYPYMYICIVVLSQILDHLFFCMRSVL